MNSSTSNSKVLVRRSFGFSFAILLAYTMLLESRFFKNGGGVGSSDWENCVIRSERYLFDLKEPQTVLIGTSLTSRIRTDLMGDQFFNLGFPCIGPAGGWELVKMKAKKPKVLVLELNLIFDDHDYVKELFSSGPPLFLRQHLKPFRKEYALPIVAKTLVKQLRALGKEKAFFWHLPQEMDHMTGRPITKSAQFQQAAFAEAELAMHVPGRILANSSDEIATFKNQAGGCDSSKCARADLAFKRIAEVQAACMVSGTKLVLLELPQPKMIHESFLMQTLRDGVKRDFPGVALMSLEPSVYATPDGLHLGEPDAVVYSIKLRNELQRVAM